MCMHVHAHYALTQGGDVGVVGGFAARWVCGLARRGAFKAGRLLIGCLRSNATWVGVRSVCDPMCRALSVTTDV